MRSALLHRARLECFDPIWGLTKPASDRLSGAATLTEFLDPLHTAHGIDFIKLYKVVQFSPLDLPSSIAKVIASATADSESKFLNNNVLFSGAESTESLSPEI